MITGVVKPTLEATIPLLVQGANDPGERPCEPKTFASM
jgi:hypothetical protein